MQILFKYKKHWREYELVWSVTSLSYQKLTLHLLKWSQV